MVVNTTEIQSAAAILQQGGTVAIPTETVYGLGADASNPAAVRRIFEIKGRPQRHPVIVHIAHIAQLGQWARNIPNAAYHLAEAFWPGPLTLILPRQMHVLSEITGGQDSVGLRSPDHPIATALLRQFGGGIAAPSANRYGRISPTTAQHVREELGAMVDLILDGGACSIGLESTIISLMEDEPVLLRPGGVTVEAIENTLKRTLRTAQNLQHEVRTSGMMKAHYAPVTPLELCAAEQIWLRAKSLAARQRKVAVLARHASANSYSPHIQLFPMPADAPGFARVLYATLHHADTAGVDYILLEMPPATSDWLAVNDRIQRAAYDTQQKRPILMRSTP